MKNWFKKAPKCFFCEAKLKSEFTYTIKYPTSDTLELQEKNICESCATFVEMMSDGTDMSNEE